ncbi:cation diffusion facilitator family transporter [Salinisphaera shabanensis T35B1]|uniref:cation transporter n=1 Tax=Salinisphaera shabanensis TaxID=180542 RepID=UPI0033419821
MAGCCSEDDVHLQAMRDGQRRVLWIVLALNAVMFVGEFTAGWIANSTALLADSLDMLGDTLVYALSLAVVAQGPRAKALSAGFKGAVMLIFGLAVGAQVIVKLLYGLPPQAPLMAVVGTLALAGNIVCLILLTRHREDDVNMSSVWVCSRNDLFANSGVIAAAALVALTHSIWPDLLIGAAIAALFLRSSFHVIGDARSAYHESRIDNQTGVRGRG